MGRKLSDAGIPTVLASDLATGDLIPVHRVGVDELEKVEWDDFFDFLGDQFDDTGTAAGLLAAHVAAADPHPQYLTAAEGDAEYDPLNAAVDVMNSHLAASNPHPQYARLASMNFFTSQNVINNVVIGLSGGGGQNDQHVLALHNGNSDGGATGQTRMVSMDHDNATDARLHVFSEAGVACVIGNSTYTVRNHLFNGNPGRDVTLAAAPFRGTGNLDGGDVILTPTPATGTGIAGRVVVRMSDGTAGLDELYIQQTFGTWELVTPAVGESLHAFDIALLPGNGGDGAAGGGDGGSVRAIGGIGGDSTNAGGPGGTVTLNGGNGGDSANSPGGGGSIFMTAGSGGNHTAGGTGGTGGTIWIQLGGPGGGGTLGTGGSLMVLDNFSGVPLEISNGGAIAVEILAGKAGQVPLAVQAPSSGAGDILQLNDSTATLVVWVTTNGTLHAAGFVGNTLTAKASAAGAGNGVTITGTAAASGNSNGGSVVLQPGAAAGSGTVGKVVVRQPAGVVGTDEIQAWHDGTDGHIQAMDAAGKLLLKDGNGWGIRIFKNGNQHTIQSAPTGNQHITLHADSFVQVGFWTVNMVDGSLSPANGDVYPLRFGSGGGLVGMVRNGAGSGTLKITDGTASASAPFGSLICGAYNASTVGLTVQAYASQADNLVEWKKSDGTVFGTISENGYWSTRKNTAPADAELSNGEVMLWLDPTPGATKLMVKAKDSGGTVRTAAINLA